MREISGTADKFLDSVNNTKENISNNLIANDNFINNNEEEKQQLKSGNKNEISIKENKSKKNTIKNNHENKIINLKKNGINDKHKNNILNIVNNENNEMDNQNEEKIEILCIKMKLIRRGKKISMRL